MRIAVEGCAHGQLEKIYDVLTTIEKREMFKIDLLICCGDFQSSRNMEDLQTMSIPLKYHDICTFYKYYSGEKVAPILTIFVGGNHEASNYLQELPYGGWVAPNIYYLGYAGVIRINGIRICGISGIYKGHDYFRGHYEFPPYSEHTKRSVYHIRQLDIYRLKQLSGDMDICISHDWPRGIYYYGNHRQLVRFKPHFGEEIESNRLGSPPFEDLLHYLKPTYWFAAHLHCQFVALVPHEDSNKMTKFLALDKCLPRRRFLQLLEIDTPNPVDNDSIKLEYDLEWLTILSLTNHLISAKSVMTYMPGPNGNGRYIFTPTEEEKHLVEQKFNNDLSIPLNFCLSSEPYDPNKFVEDYYDQPRAQLNSQTTAFCSKLNIDDPLSIAMSLSGHELVEYGNLNENVSDCSGNIASSLKLTEPINPDVIHISEEDDSNDIEIIKLELLDEESVINIQIDDEAKMESKLLLDEVEDDDEKNSLSVSLKKMKRRNECVYNDNN